MNDSPVTSLCKRNTNHQVRGAAPEGKPNTLPAFPAVSSPGSPGERAWVVEAEQEQPPRAEAKVQQHLPPTCTPRNPPPALLSLYCTGRSIKTTQIRNTSPHPQHLKGSSDTPGSELPPNTDRSQFRPKSAIASLKILVVLTFS